MRTPATHGSGEIPSPPAKKSRLDQIENGIALPAGRTPRKWGRRRSGEPSPASRGTPFCRSLLHLASTAADKATLLAQTGSRTEKFLLDPQGLTTLVNRLVK